MTTRDPSQSRLPLIAYFLIATLVGCLLTISLVWMQAYRDRVGLARATAEGFNQQHTAAEADLVAARAEIGKLKATLAEMTDTIGHLRVEVQDRSTLQAFQRALALCEPGERP